MKTIKKDELFQNLSGFLKSKGIELKDGVYPQRINRACDLLTEAINDTRKTLKCAKVKVDHKLDQLRQTIHEATAPAPAQASPSPKAAASGEAGGQKTAAKSRRGSATRKRSRAK